MWGAEYCTNLDKLKKRELWSSASYCFSIKYLLPPKKRRVLEARRENKKRKRYGYKGDVGTYRAPFIDRNGYQIQEKASWRALSRLLDERMVVWNVEKNFFFFWLAYFPWEIQRFRFLSTESVRWPLRDGDNVSVLSIRFVDLTKGFRSASPTVTNLPYELSVDKTKFAATYMK